MNSLCAFRLCDLSDTDLIKAVDKATDNMHQTGKIPNRFVPARPNEDYDLLIGELLLRFDSLLKLKNSVDESCTYNNGKNPCPGCSNNDDTKHKYSCVCCHGEGIVTCGKCGGTGIKNNIDKTIKKDSNMEQLSIHERLEQIAIDLTDIEQGECTEDNLEEWNKSLNKWITFFDLFLNKND